MPGVPHNHTSRTSASDIRVTTYISARSLPTKVWAALREHERAANIILPHAMSNLIKEDIPGQVWIICETLPTTSSEPRLELILSCTKWHMGTYPVFIVPTLSNPSLTPAFLTPRVEMMAGELKGSVKVERVYSIFAPSPLAKAFAQAWSTITNAKLEEYPYYAARFSHCSKETFIDRSMTQLPGTVYNLRPALEADIPEVAHLCKGFAAESEPFTLDNAGALKEAKYLVSNKMAWVHDVIQDGRSELAGLVATTRNSENVGTITKVYTAPKWRKRGCAERLVRKVCKHFLIAQRKKWVVLYVAHDNPAAAKVYDKVGFVGLCGKPRVDGVDDWIEIGCRNTELGHW